MLMVLMAVVEFGKTGVHKATRWLWLVLSGGLAAAPLSCEQTGNGADPAADAIETVSQDPGQPLYGPPADLPGVPDVGADAYQPVDAADAPSPGDVALVDVPVTPDVPKDCQPLAVDYGPAGSFCTTDAECVNFHGAGWYCDTGSDPCVQFCTEGVPPPDAVDATEAVPDVAVDPGHFPIEYGPPIPACTTDADCVQPDGAVWYCDKATNPSHPTCQPGTPPVDAIDASGTPDSGSPEVPVIVYGPPGV